jgi:type I restriction enzyme S subunit
MMARLGDIAEFINGGAWSDKEYTENGIPVVKVTNLKNGTVDLTEVNYIPESSLDKYGRHILRKGDLVIATVGSHPNLVASAAGRATIIPSIAEGALLNQNALCLRTNNDILNQGYLGYLGRSDLFQGYVKSVGRGAANQVRIALGLIKEFSFELPPLPTQRKIASILSAYDDLIENNLKRIKLLEEKAQLHFYSDFGEYQFGDKEPTNLPNGWTIKSIGEILGKLESGSRPKGGIDKELKNGIASIGAENVLGLGKYNYQNEKYITEEFFEKMNRGKIQDKDILIYKDGAYIGKTTLFQDSFPHDKCCVNEHVFLLRVSDQLYQNYLFFTFYQKLYFEKMQQLNANAAQPGINQESLKSLKVIYPNKKAVESFNLKVEQLMKLIFSLAKQNTKLREARDILLPRLMSGQIEV